ncbi:MAG: hypothetical protein KUG68_04415, partial [Flavobacteriaceae bacterium]|nr:hypothetical protein [Flavobacteriaceae bacterium]
KILSLTNKELIVENNGVKVTYQKLDLKKIATANKKSRLFGTWEFKGVPYSYAKTFVTFREPNEFTIIEKQEGMESTLNGEWMFNKNDMSLIMIGLRGEDTFKGQNKIIKINGETLELINNSNAYKGFKKVEKIIKVKNTIKIDSLTFSEEDFYTEDGEYKYNNERSKLPWHDLHLQLEKISETKKLVYSYAKLNEETNTFDTKLLNANVYVKVENQSFKVDNIFYGYDRSNTPEDVRFLENDENGDYALYPLNESTYRVVGEEELTLKIGAFNCTVVEAVNSNEELLKIWLIINKPAIIAKLIKTSEQTNPHYSIYELQEIINN